jgi:hypothetical protein
VLTFPRILGVLVLIWGCRGIVEALVTGQLFWVATTALWLAAGALLVTMRRVRLASLGVVALSLLELVVRVPNLTGLELLVWIALIVAVTESRPHDRALLLRTCVTVVYGFTAITKLNPSWLAGEGIAGLIVRRSQLSPFEFVAASSVLAVAAAIAVVAMEAWLAIGLWNKRTRRVTAAIGVLMHTSFVILASPNPWATVHLAVFNFGLVACYPAFWSDTRPGSYHPATGPSPGVIETP